MGISPAPGVLLLPYLWPLRLVPRSCQLGPCPVPTRSSLGAAVVLSRQCFAPNFCSPPPVSVRESSTLWWLSSCCERHLSLPSQAGPLSSQQLLLKLTSAHMEQLVLSLEQSLPVLCGENFLVGVI